MPRRDRRAPVSLPPEMVRIVPQNGHDADCAVVTLGALFGLTRDQALVACAAAAPRVLEEGMDDRQIDAALATLGVPYARLPFGSYDLHEDTGVLSVYERNGDRHFTFLWAGRVIDGNGQHWLDPEDYLQHYRLRVGDLLTRLDIQED